MENLTGTIIYAVTNRRYDRGACASQLLSTVRRRYFEEQKPVSGKEMNTDSGVEIYTRYRLSKRMFYWVRKSSGKTLQRAYCVKGSYALCSWDLQGFAVSRETYSAQHIWEQTAYFAPGTPAQAETLCPAEVLRAQPDGTVLWLRLEDTGDKYSQTLLVPSKMNPGSAEQSLINASAGEPILLADTSAGVFCYCTQEEASLREQLAQRVSAEIPEDIQGFDTSLQELDFGFHYIENDPESLEAKKIRKVVVPPVQPLGPDYPANREVLRVDGAAKPAKYAVAAMNSKGVLKHVAQLHAQEETEEYGLDSAEQPEPDAERDADEDAAPPISELLEDFPMPVKRIVISAEESYVYFGKVLQGLREGQGRTQMQNGHTAYEGDYHEDKRDGFGTYYYKSGKISYVGNWKENRRHGAGVSFSAQDGSVFVGKWINNIPTGKGSAFDAEGNLLYTGDWKEGKRCGFGTEYRDGAEYYTGEWDNDCWNGKGTLRLANGTVITGFFKDGKVDGLDGETES